MKKHFKTFTVLAATALFFSGLSFFQSCYYDNAEDLLGAQTCDTSAVSYSMDVVPILEAKCYICHSQTNAPSAGAGYVLEGYEYLMDVVSTGQLSGSIDWKSGFSPMPKGGAQLPSCERAKIRNWVDQGALNN